MSIKYYQLAKDETTPEEFCAVRDVGGEPSEYTFYVPESEVAKLRDENARLLSCLTDDAENARQILGESRALRRLVQELYEDQCDECDQWKYRDRMRELGIEVES